MRILAILLYYVLQLFPLTYRTRYWDVTERQLHFCVWRQWLGRCYSVDDVVVLYDAEMARKCIAAIEHGKYRTLDEIIAVCNNDPRYHESPEEWDDGWDKPTERDEESEAWDDDWPDNQADLDSNGGGR